MINNIKYGIAAVLIFAAIAIVFILWCIGTFDDNAGYEEFPAETWEAPAVRSEGLKVQTVACVELEEESEQAEQQVTGQAKRYYEEIPLDAELQEVLFACCDEYGIPYEIALGLIQTESQFNPYVVSYSGCYGLCQLNPVYFPSGLAPADNIRHGMKYLARQINAYGSVEAGLTAYNAGHDTGDRYYASAVLSAAEMWRGVIT